MFERSRLRTATISLSVVAPAHDRQQWLPLERLHVTISETVVLDPRGTKRTCTYCGKRFYDLARKPAVCPECHVELPAVASRPLSGRPRANSSGRYRSDDAGLAAPSRQLSEERAGAEPIGQASQRPDADNDSRAVSNELAEDGMDGEIILPSDDDDDEQND